MGWYGTICYTERYGENGVSYYKKVVMMRVKYIGKTDTVALDKNKTYEVLSVERGCYRIMTELDEDYLFPAKLFEIVEK